MSAARSGWFWAGVGCLGFVLFFVVCTAGVGFLVMNRVSDFNESLEDPEQRDRDAKAVLGTETLPEGYYPLFSLEAPFSLMKVAVLSDSPPLEDGTPSSPGERGFIYFEIVSRGRQGEEVRDYFEGRTDDARVLRDLNVNVNENDIIDRGLIDHDDVDYMYLATRGSVGVQGHAGSGLASISLVDCPGDSRLRLAVWFGPDPDPGASDDALDLTGTAADPAALDAFLGQFSLCG